MMRKLATLLLVQIWAFGPAVASAQVPAMLPVQGYLTDVDGAPLDGMVTISATIFDKLVAGNSVFTETINAVPVEQGAFIVYLGKSGVPQLDLSIFSDNPDLWLELVVNGDVIDPRFRLATVPYAALANSCIDAVTVGGMPPEDFAAVDHVHTFNQLTGVPADLADGDADTLAALSCSNGFVATYSGGAWSCAALSASAVAVGTLPTDRFSAYSDLQAENRLDGNAGLDLLTRNVGDGRYLTPSQGNVAYLRKDMAVTPFTADATDGGSSTTNAAGYKFCALTRVANVGQEGECAIVDNGGGSFDLTATAGSGAPRVYCSMRCF